MTTTWTPGVPLYEHPDLRSHADADLNGISEYTQYVRAMYSLIDDSPDDLLYKYAKPSQVRFCADCETLWVNEPRCFVCGAYARPNRHWKRFLERVYLSD